MGFIPPTRTAPAFVDRLSWHTSVSSPSARLPATLRQRTTWPEAP